MEKEALLAQVKDIIREVIQNRDVELVEIIHRYEGRDLVLRILVDKPEGGITLDQCAWLNQELGRIFEENDILQQRYILEVSSPGLDRPLVTKNDFLRCINKEVKVFMKEPIDDIWEAQGVISKVEADTVYLETGGRVMEMPILKIRRAKQII